MEVPRVDIASVTFSATIPATSPADAIDNFDWLLGWIPEGILAVGLLLPAAFVVRLGRRLLDHFGANHPFGF